MSIAMSQPMSVLTSHRSGVWFTPPVPYIELAHEVLGNIDLDPASEPFPQQWIKADRYWTQDGLLHQWNAKTVFCNPPYGKLGGKSNQAAWSRKMVCEYEAGHFKAGILLINSTHGYRWYEELWTKYPVCLARERIRFIKPDGTVGGQAKRGQTFVYFGTDPAKFIDVFSNLGRIVLPEPPLALDGGDDLFR